MPAPVNVLARLRAQLNLTQRLLSDPTWQTHRRYGMQRGSLSDVFLSTATWRSYARAVLRGRLRFPAQDIFQLGGDVVIDRDGAIRFLYRSRGSGDYAPLSPLVEAVTDGLGHSG